MRLLASLPWPGTRRDWAERLAGALLVLGASALIWFGGRLPAAHRVALWGLFAVALAVLLRRDWLRLFGPVLLWDLLRIGRQSRHAEVRTLYGGLLFGLLLFVYLAWLADNGLSFSAAFSGGAIPTRALGGYALTSCLLFLCVQLLAVFLLTPAYLAGSIAEERERRTLEGLLTSDLHDREILFGMVLARLANLLLVLLTGLPVLSLLQFMGGVEPNLILAGFAVTGLTVAGLAGLSVFQSLQARKPRQAIMRTYLFAAGYLVVSGLSWLLLITKLGLATFPSTDHWSSPVELGDVVQWLNWGNPISMAILCINEVRLGKTLDDLLPDALRQYAWFHGLIAVGACLWVSLRLRSRILQDGEVSTRQAGGRRRAGSGHKGLGLIAPPAVSQGRPMLWKELFIDAGAHRSPLGWLLVGVLAMLVFWPAAHLAYFFGSLFAPGPQSSLSDLMNFWVRMLSMVLGCLMLLQVAVHAAGTISGERERQTLDGLLATPLTNRSILFAKWFGSLCSPRGTALCLALVWALGYITGAFHPLAVPCFLAAWLAMAATVAGIGLCLSSAYGSSHKAAFWTLFAVFGLVIGAMLAAWDLSDMWLHGAEAESIMPFMTLGMLAFSPREFQEWWSRRLGVGLHGIAGALVVWTVLAYLFWRLAYWRFRREFARRQADDDPRGDWEALLKGTVTAPPLASGPGGSDAEHAPPPGVRGLAPSPRLWPRRLGFAFLVAVPFLLLAARYLYLDREARQNLQAAMAETGRLDPGWRWDDIEAAHQIEAEKGNAARVALEARQRIPARWPGEDRVTPNLIPERQLDDEQLRWLRRMVEWAQAAMAPAHQLADLPEGCFPIRWSTLHPFPMLEETHGMRSVAQFLQLVALLRAQDNDPDGALLSCRAMIGASQAIGGEPTLVSMMVRSDLQANAVATIERVLAQGEPTASALSALQRALEDEARQPLLQIGLRGDRALWDRMLERLQQGDVHLHVLTGRPARPTGLAAITGSEDLQILSFGSLTNQRAALLRYQSELVEAARLPEDRQDAEFNRVETALLKQPGVAGTFVPFTAQPVGTIRHRQALLRCALVAVALERYRREHGGWPETLALLTPSFLEKLPLDPFTGQALRYKRLKGTVVVYSVGADGVDNGGVLDRRIPSFRGPRAAASSDVGFTLWDVDQRRQPAPTSKPN